MEQQQGMGGGRDKAPALQDGSPPSSPPAGSRPPRHTTSKYDFVKVRVWLGENSDHYYVLSRFLLSRMLTVTKIPHHVAIKIALELKKLLVDNSLLDVSQNDLEANIFKLMERRDYGLEYINRYKMMTRFHHQRVPLIILVCGTACVGKSTIATQLAQRLNLPNVLQTDMVYELLRTSTDAPLTSTPIWERDFGSPEELITEFCRECRIVRKGLDGDLKKAMKDGKPVIIEGIHLDPSIYFLEENSAKEKSLEPKVEESSRPAQSNEHDNDVTRNAASANKDSSDISEAQTQTEAEQRTEHDKENSPKPSTNAIIVPIVLRMADIDHQMLLEEWIASRSASESSMSQEEEAALIVKLRTIQDYLCSFESQGVGIVHISPTTFPQTLDWLHSYLLQRIEQGCRLP